MPPLADWKTIIGEIAIDFVNVIFSIKSTNENGFKGYNWSADLNMSFPDKNANGACKEIIKMVKVNHMSIKISIKLETGRIVHFKID